MNRNLFAAIVFAVAFMLMSATGWSQALRVVEPAAGAKVGSTFTLEVSGTAGEMVRIVVAGDEIARLKLDRTGLAQARVQAPEESPFMLVVEQLDGEEVVSMTSIRLLHSQKVEPGSTAAPSSSDPVDATGTELPPPPAPPDPLGQPRTNGSPTAPPPPNDAEADTRSERAPTGGVEDPLSTRYRSSEPSPALSTRVLRILLAGGAGIFIVPTAWTLSILGAGIMTNFSDEFLERDIGWLILGTGILAGAAGTWVTGVLLKGNGSFWATLIGGIVVGSTVAFLTADDGAADGGAIVAGAFGSFVSVGGSIIGYELTSDTDADFSDKTGIHDAVIGAAPSLDGRGFSVGVSGRF